MSSVPGSPIPVRHGSCRLAIWINARPYSLRRKPAHRGCKSWVLTHQSGPRVGVSHTVTTYQGTVACSCEDHFFHEAFCKHIRSLQAAGVINRRLRPFRPSVASAAEGGVA